MERSVIKEIFSFTVKTILGFAFFWGIVLMMFFAVSLSWIALYPDGSSFAVASLGASQNPGDKIILKENSTSWDVRLRLMYHGGGTDAVLLGSSGSTVKACGPELCDTKAGNEVVKTGVKAPDSFSDIQVGDGQVAVLSSGKAELIPEASVYAVNRGYLSPSDISIGNILTWKIPSLVSEEQ